MNQPTQSELLQKEYALSLLHKTNTRIYISGPISGYPDLNALAFTAAEVKLKQLELVPVNPLLITDFSVYKDPLSPIEQWVIAMKADLKEMFGCGALYMLDNWQKSIGASWEFLNAKMLKIPCFSLDFELITLTEAEYIDLFYNTIKNIKLHDQLINQTFNTKG